MQLIGEVAILVLVVLVGVVPPMSIIIMEEEEPSNSIYETYLNFLSRYSRYNSMEFVSSLYHEI